MRGNRNRSFLEGPGRMQAIESLNKDKDFLLGMDL